MLHEAGIPFEVVPGVTAGVAAPAYAGIPVTHRDDRERRRLRHRPRGPGEARARRSTGPRSPRFPGTLVFYMGVRTLPRIAERLIAEGRPADEPVAVIERGTLPGQRTLLATLADVAERAAAERDPRARRSRSSARSPGCASSSPGSRLARCTVARSRSRARGRRRARWPPGCARSARRSSRRLRSGSSRSTTPAPARSRLRPRVRDLAERRRRCCSTACATPASWPASPSPRSARAPRARCATAASSPTSFPSARSPRGSSRRSPTCRSSVR